MFNVLKILAGSVISPIANIFVKREQRKQTKITAEAKLATAKINKEKKIALTDAEWESISKKNEDSTWKDEYVTIVITSPIVGLLAGSVWFAFSGDDRLLTGFSNGIDALTNAGLDMGELMYVVVLAAVGLKIWRKI